MKRHQFYIITSLFVLQMKESERGQDLAEYGLLVGFIAMVVVLAVALFGQNLLAFFNRLVAGMPW